MDSFTLRLKPTLHARSISLPSRTCLETPQADEHLRKLNESTSSSTLSTIGNNLSILEETYECLDEFLLSPNTQKAFSQNEKWVEEALDGYLMLLDLCATAKYISSQIREDVQGLSSFMRRRGNANELKEYLITRKNVKQVARKVLKSFRNKRSINQNKTCSSLKEIEEATIQVLESLYGFIAGTKSQSRVACLVTKLMKKNSQYGNDEETNELEKIYIGLEDESSAESLRGHLEKIESQFQEVEDGLEILFRRLIKSRISLLNILTN